MMSLHSFDVFDFAAPGIARKGDWEALNQSYGRKISRLDKAGTYPDCFRVIALDHHVGLTDGVGLFVDLLAVQVDIPHSPGIGFPLLFRPF